MTRFEKAWQQRDLLGLAGFWQIVALVLTELVADREFYSIALRVWACFWLVLIIYLFFRTRLKPTERLLWSFGSLLIFVILAARCVSWP